MGKNKGENEGDPLKRDVTFDLICRFGRLLVAGSNGNLITCTHLQTIDCMYRSCLIHVWKIYLELFKNSDSIHGAFVNVHIVSSGGFGISIYLIYIHQEGCRRLLMDKSFLSL